MVGVIDKLMIYMVKLDIEIKGKLKIIKIDRELG